MKAPLTGFLITGGAGTEWSSEHIDGEYTRLDRPDEGKPGYFTLRSQTVRYNANGHGTAPEEEVVDYNTKATAPTDAPTATGYTFGGWCSDKACTTLWSFDTPVTEDMTLYAKWTPVTYTVTYESSGGSAVATGSYNIETETFDLPVPTRAGYTFDGWKVTAAAEGGTGFAADDVLTDSSITLSGAYGDVALTAQWTAAALTGTVTVSGTAKYGENLTAAVSDDNNTGTLSYQWKRGGGAISGATDQTYTLTQDDIGSTITCAVSSSVQTDSIESEATAKVAKLDADYTAPTANTGLTYTGSAQELIQKGSDNVLYALGSQSEVPGTWSNDVPTGTNANTYYVWYKVEADEIHSEMAAAGPFAVIIEKATPDIGDVSYNGDIIYPSTAVNSVSDGLTRSNTEIEGTLALDGVESFTTAGTQEYPWKFTPADTANYNNATGTVSLTVTADTLQSLTVEGTLSKTEYTYGEPFDITGVTVKATFESGNEADVTSLVTYDPLSVGQTEITLSYTSDGVTETCTISGITVGRAAAPNLAEQQVSHKFAQTGDQTISVADLLPADAGTLSYTKGTSSDENSIISNWFVDTDGTVSYTLTGTGAVGNTATLPVTIASANYEDSTVNVVITLTDKDIPTATANDITVTYTGTAIPDSAITGTADVDGTWRFKNPAPVNVAESRKVAVVFTPTDSANYAAVECNILVTINKATPTGTPTYTSITAADKTLADAALAIGSITPTGGTLAWELPETTVVAANTSYVWTYTPADTANYNNLTGSVLLYPVSSGGGGSVTTPKSETVSVSGQVEVKVTVSGDTATVGEISAADIAKVADASEEPKPVVIDLTGLDQGVSSATLTNSTFSNLAEAAKNDNSGVNGVEIALPGATVTLDADTLTAVQAQAGGKDITLTVTVQSTAELTTAQRDTVGGLTAPLVIDAAFTAEGKPIGDFGGGIVAVTAPYSLPAGKTASDISAYYLSGKGLLVPVASSYNEKTGEITVYAPHFSDYVISADGDPCAPFGDVNRNAWYHNAADFAVINGLMGGYSDTAFGPDDKLTRAQLVTILWRSEGAPVVNYAMDFADVPSDTWYTEAVRWAAANSIVSGYGDGRFGPDDSITREQLATILCRYAAFQGDDVSLDPDTNFLSWNDVRDISDWARDSLFWCIQSGIINGTGNGILAPKGTATRAQTAQVLMKYLGK